MLSVLENRSPKDVGERLRAARSNAGLTQQKAADDLKFARTTLIAIEKGERRVRTDEFRAMAALYGISVNRFFQSECAAVELIPRFRALSGISEQDATDAARMLSDLAIAEFELEQILNMPLRRDYPPERRIGPGDIREQAEDAALDTRQRLGLGISPVNDIVSLLELDVGIRVFVQPLRSAVSGLFVFDEKIGACMLLNRNHPRERRAMTAAHEYAHFLSTRQQPDVLSEPVQGAQSREERFAAAFAPSLMLPAAAIRRRFEDLRREAGRFSPRHLILLAHQFNVSEEALCRRLEELGLVRAGMWESLRGRGFSGEFVREVLGDKAKVQETPVSPRIWYLASEAYRRDLLSEGQIADRLGMDRVSVRAMLDSTMLDGSGTEALDDLESVPVE
ncbi:MAG: XRE family transcriptional regulator [Bryobacteraceae bacterium]|jgi:Zn-dependent peptidase ImmA (M78 family)/DNA-binding XRE family transcriptional regulator